MAHRSCLFVPTKTPAPLRASFLANGGQPAALARTVVGNEFFYNQLSLPFDSLGTTVSFPLCQRARDTEPPEV